MPQMILEIQNKRNWAVYPLVLALLYASLMISVPWESMARVPFWDREVYLRYFETAADSEHELSFESLREFILNETLWDIVAMWFIDTTKTAPNDFLTAVSFVCFFVFSKYLFERHSPAYCALLLLNPILIDFAMSQLRMAFAASLLLIALGSRNSIFKIAVAVSAMCVHSASTLFIIIYWMSAWLMDLVEHHRIGKNAAVTLAVLFAFIIVMTIGPARPIILGYLGDRRAEYEPGASTWTYGSFWIVLLAFQSMQPRQYFLHQASLYSTMIVSVFIFTILFSLYGSRFIAAAFPLLISSILQLNRKHRQMVLGAFVFYVSAQWYYWM